MSPGWSLRADAHVETARTSAGGTVTGVIFLGALRETVVSASGMVSWPSSRVHQVWVMILSVPCRSA